MLTPSQLSATSQTPAEPRQTAVDFASAGHAPLEPVHDSALSQTPADARHCVPEVLSWQVEVQHDVAVLDHDAGVQPRNKHAVDPDVRLFVGSDEQPRLGNFDHTLAEAVARDQARNAAGGHGDGDFDRGS